MLIVSLIVVCGDLFIYSSFKVCFANEIKFYSYYETLKVEQYKG